MLVFYFFAAIVIWLGILSLRGGIRFAAYVRSETAKPLADFTPLCFGVCSLSWFGRRLEENLTALFQQDYPAYEIVFVSDSADDPSLALIRKLIEAQDQPATFATKISHRGTGDRFRPKGAQPACGCCRNATREAKYSCLSIRTRGHKPHWLRSLVAPLADENVGAASGYRWFVPLPAGLPRNFVQSGTRRLLRRWARTATITFVGAAQLRFVDQLSKSCV